jgi:hypothetical protein
MLLTTEADYQDDYQKKGGLYSADQGTNRLSVILFKNNNIRHVRTLAPYGQPFRTKVWFLMVQYLIDKLVVSITVELGLHVYPLNTTAVYIGVTSAVFCNNSGAGS